jgi:hypothetical protein
VLSTSSSPSVESTRWGWLIPPEREELHPATWRAAGKTVAITMAVFMVGNLFGIPRSHEIGMRADVYLRTTLINTPLLFGMIVVGITLWRASLGPGMARALVYTSLVLMASSLLLLLWTHGSVTSYLPAVIMVTVMGYRAAFDVRVGLWAFALFFAGQWTVVALEALGTIPSAPLMMAPPSLPARARIAAMYSLSVVNISTFLLANYAAIRLQYKDRALRILRARMLQEGGARIGRHSGAILNARYALGTLLGAGGTGEVYAARDRREDRDVAVKLLHPYVIENEKVLARLSREASVTAALGSPHIVEVHGLEQTEEGPALILELLQGESLAARLERTTTLSLAETVELVAQAAGALTQAHGAGIVHRDLKPENMFLMARPDHALYLKILDFGASKVHGAMTALTCEQALIGTPLYMSPEQAMGANALIGPETDVFALACVAYRALTGVPAFRADTVSGVLYRVCEEAPVSPSAMLRMLPPDVDLVVLRGLFKDPRQRTRDVATFAEDLASASRGQLPQSAREETRRLLERGAAGRAPRDRAAERSAQRALMPTLNDD